MRKIPGIILFTLLSFLVTFNNPAAESRPRAMVSILPQKYFLERLSGGKWDIDVMIPPGYNPAVYEPTPLQLKKLSRARVYFRIGYIGFELAWMKHLQQLNPAMRIIDTSGGVQLISGHGNREPYKGKPGKGTDPHIWLSPGAVRVIAGHMTGTLAAMDPVNRSVYLDNHRRFMVDIDRLDKEIRRIFSDKSKKKFLVYHPAWTYFARDYGLTQISIETEGKEPAPSDMKHVIDQARREGIRAIIVQSQFDTHSAETIARSIGGTVVRLDPLASNWLENLLTIARKIDRLLQ